MISLDLRIPSSAVPSESVSPVISTPSAATPVTRSLNHVRAHGSTPLVRQSVEGSKAISASPVNGYLAGAEPAHGAPEHPAGAGAKSGRNSSSGGQEAYASA